MKLLTFMVSTPIGTFKRIGALIRDYTILDLTIGYASFLCKETGMIDHLEMAQAALPPDMIRFFAGGEASKEAALRTIDFVNALLEEGGRPTGPASARLLYNFEEVKLCAPVPRPNTIRDFMTFKKHALQASKAMGVSVKEIWHEIPVYYKGNPCTVIGHMDDIIWPKYTEKLDYELEFGIYIGRKGKDIAKKNADDYIAGYTIFNDVSARDRQAKEMQLPLGPGKGKDFDTSNVMGPYIVTPDEIKDPANLNMVARVNGEVWSSGNSSDMHFSFADMIAYISEDETLYPGDFLGSGTVGGGCGVELDKWLKPGDVIELEVEGIGVLRNKVVRK